MDAIEIQKLTKYYGKHKGAEDVTISVKKGEVFGFIGPNGAGKSTTIRTILNFIHPTSGRARILGMDCTTQSNEIKRHIGYLPSEVNYYDDMKVGELLAYSAKFYKKDCSNRIKELSEIFELDLSKKIDQLSYGNRKKTAILQALIHEPEILILDEPTGGLDPLMQNKFFEVLKEENRKGVTIFFSSHILSEVQKICDRVAIIKDGHIVKIEEVEKLRNNKYKKIKIEFSECEYAQSFSIEGMKEKEVKNSNISFMYSGKMGTLISALSDINQKVENIWIEEPSLEEVFMHYYEKGEK